MVREALLTSLLPKHLGYFEGLLSNSSSGWLAGTALPTIADFYMAESFLALRSNLEAPDVLAGWPLILGLIEKVHALPAIKAWDEAEAAKTSNL
jgi:glutathione S-transferase